MMCVTNVALSDWPLGQARDVDPTHEKIQGLLAGGYIVPLVRRRPPEKPADATVTPGGPDTPQDDPTPAPRTRRAAAAKGKTSGE